MSSVEIDLAIPIEREIGKAAATWYQFRNEGAQHQQHQGINDTKKQRHKKQPITHQHADCIHKQFSEPTNPCPHS